MQLAKQKTQEYNGAQAPLQLTLGVDKVITYWIRECGITFNSIPKDIFRFLLKYTSFFDEFEFQENIYWDIDKTKKEIKKATKRMGMGTYHNILFGSILTGDIEFKCKAKYSQAYGWSDKGGISVGLVEPHYYQYIDANMHTGKYQRCVFKPGQFYYDCDGIKHEYFDENQKLWHIDDNFYNIKSFAELEICVNMKFHTFSVTNSEGDIAIIKDIPNERVLCFEMWPAQASILITEQSLQWVHGNEQKMEYEDSDDKPECAICLKPLTENERKKRLICLHTFHLSCIQQWENMGNRTCPLCRMNMQ